MSINPFFFYLSSLSSIVVVIAICQRVEAQGSAAVSVSYNAPVSASVAVPASESHARQGQHLATTPSRRISVRRWLELCGSSSLAIYAIHWMFVPFVCAPIFNYLVPLHPSMLFRTACSLLAFFGILALTLPAAWLVENKMKWMVIL